MRRVLATAALLCLPLAAAHAQTQQLDFTYAFADGNIETGVLNGTLAADGNHFTVSSIASLSYDGTTVTSTDNSIELLSLDSANGDGGGYNGDGSAVVTLNGSYMDMITEITNASETAGVFTYFGVNDVFSLYAGNVAVAENYYAQSVDAGDAGWSAEVADVPEPAGLAVFGIGLAALATLRRRAKTTR